MQRRRSGSRRSASSSRTRASTQFQDGVFRNTAAPSGNYRVKLAIQAGVCAPAAEPWHTYLGTPDECESLHWTCPTGENRFVNACGCGCERPN